MRNPRPFPFLRGVNFGYLSKQPYYGTARAEAEVDRMAEAGVEWVSLMVMLMQETYHSTRVFRDFRWTPTDIDLAKIVARIQARGMRVLLKPVIDCLDSSWRGRIAFPDGDQQIQGVVTDYWSRWFESNREAMTYYASLGREWGVEAFTVGQELEGTDLQTARWRETIAAVREAYPGWVVLNAQKRREEPAFLDWVRDLDAIGFSNYSSVAIDHPGVDQVRAMTHGSTGSWKSFHEKTGLKIYWAEFGCRSVQAGARTPWEYRNDGAYDGEVQANYIDGFLSGFRDQDWWTGFQYWKWDEQQNRPHYHRPEGDTGFTVQGKPAAEVLRRWCQAPTAR